MTELCVQGTIKRGGEPTLVLLHSLAMDRTIWNDPVALLEGHQVITCDLPGHGESCRQEKASIEDYAREVAEYLRSLGVAQAVVAGLSLGGCVAQALTVRYPDLVSALCLVDTTAWYGPDAPQKWEERAQRVVRDGFDSLAGFQLDRWFSEDFRVRRSDMGERLLEIFRANDVESYVTTCRAMGEFDYRKEIKRISVPTTVLVGENDPATPLPFAELLASQIPDSRLRIVEGASHMSPVERPDVFVEEVQELLARANG